MRARSGSMWLRGYSQSNSGFSWEPHGNRITVYVVPYRRRNHMKRPCGSYLVPEFSQSNSGGNRMNHMNHMPPIYPGDFRERRERKP